MSYTQYTRCNGTSHYTPIQVYSFDLQVYTGVKVVYRFDLLVYRYKQV